MAIRTITWTVDNKFNVTPSTTQDGGIQGEDKATEVVFVLLDEQPKGIHYHIEYTGSVYDVTEALTVASGKITFSLPRAWTQGGGAATLRLVGEVDGTVVYSVEGRIRYRDRRMSAEREQTLLEGTVMQAVAAAETAAAEAGKSAGDAGAAADAAEKFATDAKTAEAAAEAAQDAAEAAVGQAAVQVGLAKEARDETERFKNDAAGNYDQYTQSLSTLQQSAAAKVEQAASWARKAELQAIAAGAAAADALTYKQDAEGVMRSVNNMAGETDVAKDEAVAAQTAAVAARDEAVLAKNQATVAKSGAEAAKSAAGTAKSGAETAQTAAEAAAADAATLVAQADAALQAAQIATAALTAQTANALTADRRGCAVRVDDLSPLEHPYTVTVERENLIPYPFADTTKTNGDYTFTDNGNGTVSFSGGRTDSTVPQGIRFTFVDGLLLSAGTYVLSGGADVRAPLHFVLETAEGASTYMLNAATDTQEITVLTDAQLTVFATLDRSLMGRTVVFAPKAVRKDLSDVTVHKHGKNLLPYPFAETTKSMNGITFTDNGDGSLTVNGTATKFARFYLISNTTPLTLPKGVTITVSGLPESVGDSNYITFRAVADNKNTANDKGYGDVLTTAYTEYECYVGITSGYTLNNIVIRPQLELDAVTAYEAYKTPTVHTVNDDGLVEGVELLPGEATTLITNTADTVVRCIYNRDTNKVIEELVNAILSLGGNV